MAPPELRAICKDTVMTFDESQPRKSERPLLKGIWFVLVPFLAIGLLAMGAGVVVGALQAGRFGLGFYLALTLAAAVLIAAVWLIRRNLHAYALPRSPRMRQGRLLLYIAGLTGAVLGALMIAAQGGEPRSMTAILRGEAPLPQAVALILAAGVVLSLLLSVRWHRLLDEHERAAYDFGAVVAIYLYFGLSSLWWLLSRGDLVPAPDGVAIFFAVTAAWLAGWLVRRFR